MQIVILEYHNTVLPKCHRCYMSGNFVVGIDGKLQEHAYTYCVCAKMRFSAKQVAIQ